MYTQALEETHFYDKDFGDGQERFKLTKQRQFLRALRFNFIKDSYNKSMSSSGSQRRIKIAMYVIPGVVSFGLGLSNYF